MQTYDCISVSDDRVQSKETNDCAVVALAVAANVPYDFARGLMCGNGRRLDSGTMELTTVQSLYDLGWRLENVTGYRGKSIQTVRKALAKGIYLVNTKGHIFCLRDGVIEDWTRRRSLRVLQVRKLVRWYCEVCNTHYKVNQYDCPPPELQTLPDSLAAACRDSLRCRPSHTHFISERKLCYECASRLHAYPRY